MHRKCCPGGMQAIMMQMRQVSSLVLVLVVASWVAPAQKPDTTGPWAGVRFLIGTWEAKTTGGQAQVQSTGTYSFRLELRDHVLARRTAYGTAKARTTSIASTRTCFTSTPGGPGQSLRAIYFDNEGHVIHYAVSVPKPGTAVLLSDADQPGPQFRLSYELNAGVMTGKFQMRMPGQQEFASYLEWSGKRKY